MTERKKGGILFVGQSYYNTWYLSRALRRHGWRADTLNVDSNPANDKYYHGTDYSLTYGTRADKLRTIFLFLRSLYRYDIFHFSGAHTLRFLYNIGSGRLPDRWDIRLLKKLGKKIVYSNNGCLDGVSQSSFRTWGPHSVCDICRWRDHPNVCSDDRNLAWGRVRNELTDYQVTLGGNRKDFNDDPTVHEVPGFYCLDPSFWDPGIEVPTEHRVEYPEGTVKIYHAVGEYAARTDSHGVNIKSTHIYKPTVERLKAEGYPVELMFVHGVPNTDVRYYQVQADIVVDMLTFGFFGANVREALMLGKPAVCFLRPEWLESMRREIPEYVDEIPVISATPETVYDILKDLVLHPEKRREIGRRSREFAVKWHSDESGARQLDRIYSELLRGRTPEPAGDAGTAGVPVGADTQSTESVVRRPAFEGYPESRTSQVPASERG